MPLPCPCPLIYPAATGAGTSPRPFTAEPAHRPRNHRGRTLIPPNLTPTSRRPARFPQNIAATIVGRLTAHGICPQPRWAHLLPAEYVPNERPVNPYSMESPRNQRGQTDILRNLGSTTVVDPSVSRSSRWKSVIYAIFNPFPSKHPFHGRTVCCPPDTLARHGAASESKPTKRRIVLWHPINSPSASNRCSPCQGANRRVGHGPTCRRSGAA